MISSYSKIYDIGHRQVKELFNEEVLIEEKVDGSQISFGIYDGELKMRSRGADIHVDTPEGMFSKAVEAVKYLDLMPGWTYRGEYLQKPKHNTLAYARIPKNHIMIFDIDKGGENYLNYYDKQVEAGRLNLETVPVLFEGTITTVGKVTALLERVSVLGGQKVEGVVVKNYHRTSDDKKTMMGKYVSEAFKETHQKAWKASNPNSGDIIENLIGVYSTPARWDKAIQHLREAGRIEDSPKDIGPLIQEVKRDVFEEESEAITAAILKWARPKIERGLVAGLPEYYKKRLLEQQFGSFTDEEAALIIGAIPLQALPEVM